MFCVRGFGGGWGSSLFLGGCSGFPSCFLGLLGFSVFLVRSAPACWGGWRVAGGSGARGRRARVSCFLLVGGRVWGASARARFLSCPVLAVVGSGGRVRGARVARFPWWGSGCARFLLLLVVVGVFGCCFFRPALLVFSWFPVLVFVVLPGVGGCGGCRVGFGVFSPASAVLARACLGLGWVLFGEFDPGSGRTLAACLTHASRTGPPLWGWVEWRTGEYHVSNLPPAPG